MDAEPPRLQHWLVCTWAEPEDPDASGAGPLRLHGVSPMYALPPGWEFPADPTAAAPAIPELHLFARFDGGSGRTDFEVRVYWMDAPGGPAVVEVFGPYLVDLPDEPYDRVFQLRAIPAPGPGLYAAQLVLLPAVGTGGRPTPGSEPAVLGVEYLYLVEAPT